MRAHSNIAHDTCPRRFAIGPPVAERPAGLCSQAARPVAATAADAAGSVGSPAVAASASTAKRNAGPASLDDLTSVHSPDISLVDPAACALGVNFAEPRLARLETRDNAGL